MAEQLYSSTRRLKYYSRWYRFSHSGYVWIPFFIFTIVFMYQAIAFTFIQSVVLAACFTILFGQLHRHTKLHRHKKFTVNIMPFWSTILQDFKLVEGDVDHFFEKHLSDCPVDNISFTFVRSDLWYVHNFNVFETPLQKSIEVKLYKKDFPENPIFYLQYNGTNVEYGIGIHPSHFKQVDKSYPTSMLQSSGYPALRIGLLPLCFFHDFEEYSWEGSGLFQEDLNSSGWTLTLTKQGHHLRNEYLCFKKEYV